MSWPEIAEVLAGGALGLLLAYLALRCIDWWMTRRREREESDFQAAARRWVMKDYDHWRCTACGEVCMPISQAWQWTGDRWRHLHPYPAGYFDAVHVPYQPPQPHYGLSVHVLTKEPHWPERSSTADGAKAPESNLRFFTGRDPGDETD